jgi:hypothetical protein
MKFNKLTKEQQAKAINYHASELLKAILEGLRFNDKLNNDKLQSRIDKAMAKAEAMRTPWFSHEYIMDDKYCKERIEGMALCDAEDCDYELNSKGELCVKLQRLVNVEAMS